MEFFRSVLFWLSVVLLAACGAAYPPPQNVVSVSQQMTKQEALETIQQLLRPSNDSGRPVQTFSAAKQGLCASGVFGLDARKELDFKVTEQGISFNAIRRGERVRTETSGTVNSTTGMTIKSYYKVIAYREALLFDKIDHVLIHEPGVLTARCVREEYQSEVIVNEKDGENRWYVAIIPTAAKQRLIAALLRMKPDLEFRNRGQATSTHPMEVGDPSGD